MIRISHNHTCALFHPRLNDITTSLLDTGALLPDGEPNTTVISQIWYVDENHVALSFQFFNKTKKNISENPYAYATISDPDTLKQYNLELKFDHEETEGDLFDEMDMKLQAIASMTGMTGIFKLQAADVYKVLSISE